MKITKSQNFEKELPEGYKQALYINAKAPKFGIIFNIIALVIMVLVMVVANIPLYINGELSWNIIRAGSGNVMTSELIVIATLLAYIVYIVLHELVHGIAYKSLTGEKLTFGVSLTCAFCGVPHIFTYRKTALIAVLSPFVLFTLIFLPIAVALYFVSPLYYLLSALLFAAHLGGCCGDLYVSYLIMVKFRKKQLLMRDTGPEQFFYIRDEK
ncbi:MAG: DUF3267 domain-containing protein [Clostridia bacterium]|nr:DUF3267 domain-containing protein [Clostridia bacterium]